MPLTVLTISGASKGAKAALGVVTDATRKWRTKLGGAETVTDALKAETTRLSGALTSLAAAEARAGAGADVLALKANQVRTALGAGGRDGAGSGAAGAVGNLTAQFNDIGVQLAGGQSPFLIALQQGTQITQALGPGAGAAGAVRALGSAFVSMLNPISLATIAAITLGGSVVQWFTSAGDTVATVEDKLKSLETAMKALDAAQKSRATSAEDLVGQYGRSTEAAIQLLDVQRQLAQLDANRALNTAIGGISGGLGSVRFDVDALQLASEAFSGIGRSADEIERASGAINGIDPTAVARLAADFGITRDAAQLVAQQIAALETARGPEAIASALRDVREQLELAAGGYADMNTEAREVVDQLSAAEQAALRLAGIDLAQGIAAASGAAADLARNLGISLSTAVKIAALGPQGSTLARDPSGGVYSGRGSVNPSRTDSFIAGSGGISTEAARILRDAGKTSRGASGGGKTDEARAAEQSAKAIADLTQRYQDELAILNAVNPVEQELLRNRQALSGATAAQRNEVASLITQIEAQKTATVALSFAADTAGDALIDGLLGGKNAGEQLIKTLQRAVLEATLLGKGPLAGFFGGGGGGGLVGTLFGGFLKKAGGGMIYGPGGPTDDRVPAMLSNGEFVVNAAATARNRALLEAVNGGGLPGFARGGAVGGGSPSGGTAGGGGGGSNGRMQIDLAPGLVASIREQGRADAIDIAQSMLTSYDRTILPTRFSQISNDRRRIG